VAAVLYTRALGARARKVSGRRRWKGIWVISALLVGFSWVRPANKLMVSWVSN
jgi:hypothetical protein